MKSYKKNLILTVLIAIFATSCGLDNYDAPKSELHGKITYNGQPLGLRGSGQAVRVQLYQDGYALSGNFEAFVGQDGTFNALVFDGEYKIVTRDRNGPWVNTRDTLVVNVKGNTVVELKVTPYFTISNESLTLSGSTLNTSFTINQIVSTAEIDRVFLLVSKTSFVDDAVYIARKDFGGVAPGAVTLSMDMDGNNNVASAKALYARVGVLTKGADQAIYSSIVRLK